MQNFKKRNTRVHHSLQFGFALLGMLVLVGIAGVAVSSAWRMYGTFAAASEARHNAEQQLVSLEGDHARVSASVASFQSPEGVESQVRERFGVVKPGEGEIQIVREQNPTPVESAQGENIFMHIFHSLFVW